MMITTHSTAKLCERNDDNMHHIYYWQIQKKSERKLKKKLKKIEKKNRKNMVMCGPWYVPTAARDLILFSIFSNIFSHFSCNTMNI